MGCVSICANGSCELGLRGRRGLHVVDRKDEMGRGHARSKLCAQRVGASPRCLCSQQSLSSRRGEREWGTRTNEMHETASLSGQKRRPQLETACPFPPIRQIRKKGQPPPLFSLWSPASVLTSAKDCSSDKRVHVCPFTFEIQSLNPRIPPITNGRAFKRARAQARLIDMEEKKPPQQSWEIFTLVLKSNCRT